MKRGSAWICLLSLLEEFVEEYDNPRHMTRRPTDDIAARDGWRCTAPLGLRWQIGDRVFVNERAV